MSAEKPILALALARDADAGPWIAALQPRLPGLAVRRLGEAEPAAVRYVAAWKHEPGALATLPGLTAIFSLGAGVDHLLADQSLPAAVPLVRVVDPDLTARMSEWVVLHVLLHHRQQRLYDYQQYEKLWDDDPTQPAARDVRVGVMGLGEMGTDAVRKLQVMGFDVAGWSRGPKTLPGVVTFAGSEGLGPFLARTQILVVLLPLTPATRGLLDRPLFEQLARDSHVGGPTLINAGRGGLQDEAAILSCLEDGTLRAATLDVFETEPLPQASPLWRHPAVTVTPHNAAISSPEAVAAFIAAQIGAHEDGRALRHLVDRSVGY